MRTPAGRGMMATCAGPLHTTAAGDLVTLYAAAYPERVAHLILLTPGLDAVGVEETDEQWRAALARRLAEPWYPAAPAAFNLAATREALGRFAVPVLVYAGELDASPTPET